LTRAQQLQNRAFLKALRRTGNLRLAAREVGAKYGTMQHRRAKHPAFALACDAALAFAQARFARVGRRGPKAGPSTIHSSANDPPPHELRSQGGALRTRGGEPVIVRRTDGKLQMRAAQPGKLTRECEQTFLAALSATANVKLSAAAAGASVAAFYRRRRQNPAFAREMRLALQLGYDRLEMALIETGMPDSHEHDDWRSNDPPAIPPMTASQALQLMYLHQKEARLLGEPSYLKRRRSESREAHSLRLAEMWEAREQRAREEFEVAEAARMARGEPPWGPAGEDVRRASEGRVVLPDLAQVTGWSRADPTKAPHDEGRALFGGWRIEDMERKRRG
jgi:hypothetical protein